MTPCAWHSLKALVAALAITFTAQAAQAATSVATLGVRSLDGEDDLERRLSAALRASAKGIQGLDVGDRELALEQMLLAHGCDEPDEKCLAEVARTLTVDKLVFGSVSGAGGTFELTLHAYDSGTNRIESATERGLGADKLAAGTAADTLTPPLLRVLGREPPPVAALPTTGTLHIEGGVPYSQVLIDGTIIGALDGQGALAMTLDAGQHTVRPAGSTSGGEDERLALVEAGGHDTVSLSGSAVGEVEQPPGLGAGEPEEPKPSSSRRLRRTLGWASVGVGAAFAIATVYSWVRIERINKDEDYRDYRAAFTKAGSPGGVNDVCGPASRGELASQGTTTQAALERRANELCDEASTLETLQWVFIGGTVVGGGVGTYLLLTSRDEDKKAPAPAATLRINPRFGAQSAGLAATLTF